MRTVWRKECYLCGTFGSELYGNLSDKLYGVPGTWYLYECRNKECGLIWLNPVPLEEDIWIAYEQYFTHEDHGSRRTVLSHIYEMLRTCIEYGTGLHREKLVVDSCYLNEQKPGKLLEVGCGAGDYLARMQSLGWEVEGVEIDSAARRLAQRKHDLLVREGGLERRNYCEDTFDAVVLNHVIEHVFDPVSLLKECRRVMKQSGRAIVLTPNAKGRGHGIFKRDWTGLDPPRHIFVFSPRTLNMTANAAGFTRTTITTTAANAGFFFRSTLNSREYGSQYMEGDSVDRTARDSWGNGIRHARALLSQVMEFHSLKENPGIGEEIAMICEK